MSHSITLNKSIRRYRIFSKFAYYRDLILGLAIREVKVLYRSCFFGFLWALGSPLIQLAVFGFLFNIILRVNIERYSSLAFIGVLSWIWFDASLNQGAISIIANRDLIKKPGFPVDLLPIVAICTHGFYFLCAYPILFLFLIHDGVHLGWGLLIDLPLIMITQFLFALSLAYLFAGLNVVFRDLQHCLRIIMRMCMFLTPIFYTVDRIPPQYLILVYLNPMAQLIESYRTSLIEGAVSNWNFVLKLFLLSVCTMYLTHKLFCNMRHKFAESL